MRGCNSPVIISFFCHSFHFSPLYFLSIVFQPFPWVLCIYGLSQVLENSCLFKKKREIFSTFFPPWISISLIKLFWKLSSLSIDFIFEKILQLGEKWGTYQKILQNVPILLTHTWVDHWHNHRWSKSRKNAVKKDLKPKKIYFVYGAPEWFFLVIWPPQERSYKPLVSICLSVAM